jgi:hypothetical protein
MTAAAKLATCSAHCESRLCHLPAGHAGLHETPAYERLSTGGRRFGDLYPAGWHSGDGLDDERARQTARVRQLWRMPKRDLIAIVAERARERGASWLIGGPPLWSKDELLSAVIRFEWPEADRCDADRCTWPDGPHSPFCVPGVRLS